MKIGDLDYLDLRPTTDLNPPKITGGIAIEALSTVISLGDTFAYSKTLTYTFAYAPGLSFFGNLNS